MSTEDKIVAEMEQRASFKAKPFKAKPRKSLSARKAPKRVTTFMKFNLSGSSRTKVTSDSTDSTSFATPKKFTKMTTRQSSGLS